jgi:hypothetical protein
MAAVDMRRVNFWLPPDCSPTQGKASHKQRHRHRPASATADSRNKAVPLNDKESAIDQSGQSQSAAAVTEGCELSTHSEGDRAKTQGVCEAEIFSGKNPSNLQ